MGYFNFSRIFLQALPVKNLKGEDDPGEIIHKFAEADQGHEFVQRCVAQILWLAKAWAMLSRLGLRYCCKSSHHSRQIPCPRSGLMPKMKNSRQC